MLRVGLTGGIASGKTTVAAMFRARGARILEADRIAHRLMAPGQPAYDEIVRAFGKEVLGADGSIDRKRLGAIVFADAARREQLNRIVHPRVIEEQEKELARIAAEEPGAVAMVEAALLVEAGYHKQLDKLVVTWCRPEQQLERLLAKGLSREDAARRIAAQLPPEEKRRLADFVIDCSGSLAETEKQVERVWQALQQAAASKKVARV
ncbi:MAG: dephospho-CoA kinase [Acidobacteria bacterium]|nr:dephospho-CoA kinase [Acidobacteriota bacterium]